VDICRNELTVATHAALSIDHVVDLADGTEALRDLLSLRAEALGLEARRLHCLCEMLQAGGSFWRATWATLLRCVAYALPVPLSLLKPRWRLGGRLGSRPLLGGHGAGDGFDQFMLPMEEVWRVVRPKVMGNIRQPARRFIACRLDPLTVQTCKRLFHEGMPRVLIAAWGCLLQEDVVALGLSCHQAKPPSTRCILGPRDGFGGHVFGSTRAFLVPIRPDGLLHLPVDLVLRPIGSRDKAIKAWELQEEAHQAHATGADCGTHHVYPEDEAMQESKTWEALKKGHHSGTLIEPCLGRLPRLEGTAGPLELVGRLPLGETLGLQRAIRIKARSAFKAIPA